MIPVYLIAVILDLGAKRQRHVQDPEPEEHDDHAADRAVGLVVVAEVPYVEAEAQGGQHEDQQGMKDPMLIQRNVGWRMLWVA